MCFPQKLNELMYNLDVTFDYKMGNFLSFMNKTFTRTNDNKETFLYDLINPFTRKFDDEV